MCVFSSQGMLVLVRVLCSQTYTCLISNLAILACNARVFLVTRVLPASCTVGSGEAPSSYLHFPTMLLAETPPVRLPIFTPASSKGTLMSGLNITQSAFNTFLGGRASSKQPEAFTTEQHERHTTEQHERLVSTTACVTRALRARACL